MSPIAIGLVLSSFIANEPAAAALNKEVAPFAGNWQAVEIEINGRKLPDQELKTIQFLIVGNTMTSATNDGVRITFKVFRGTTPTALDLDVAIGPNSERREHFEGIVVVEGDTFKMCWNNGQGVKQRPGEFSGADGSNNFLLVFKRLPR